MKYFFFYLFCALSVISCLLTVFSHNKSIKKPALIIFLLSISGIITLLNGGYISLLIMVLSGGYYSYKLINNILIEPEKDNNDVIYPVHIIQLLVISFTGALIASLAGSTMWQGKVHSQKEITIANFGESVSSEYFVFLLVIIVSAFLISLNFKQRT